MTVSNTIRVLGIGNVLMGDDGFGPYVIRVLEAHYEFPENVEVVDGGTPGLDFAPYLEQTRSLIVIDTVSSKGPAGTITHFTKDELLAMPVPARTNPHQPGLREALMAAELTDGTPEEIVLVGVVPSTTETATRLSEAVQAAVPEVVRQVVAQLERLDAAPSRREPPNEPDIWWE